MIRRRLVVLIVTVAMLFASMDFTVLASETKEIESTVTKDENLSAQCATEMKEQGITATSSNAVVSGFPLPSGRYGVTVLGRYSWGDPHLTYLYNYGPLKGQTENSDIIADIDASNGTTIYAVANGTVITNKYGSGSGNYLVIKHDDGSYSHYAHMQARSSYTEGTRVTTGTAIGKVGKTGTATGYHLHFEWSGHDPYCEYSALGFLYTVSGSGAAVYPHKHSTTPTPQPTSDSITFQTPTYSNVTETTAYVQVNVTADCSQLSTVGMIWNEVVGGSYRPNTDFSWTVGNKLTKISVDFGKEKDKNGNIPTLSPGTTYDCNFFAITKTGKILYSTSVRFTTKSAAVSDTIPPAISNVKVTPTNGGYYVECDVYDNVGVTKVAFPTWTIKNGQDDLQTPWPIGEAWSHKLDGTATYVIKINASDHNNEEGYYTTHIYAYDAAGNQSMVAVSPDTYVDRTAPTISDIKIVDLTNTGYTVQCKVTDNVGVSKVQFPTWTEKNGQDDIIWGEGTKNGDIYSYRVNISNHNNEYGIYHTHIYAYDAMGNQRSAAAPDCTINAITITQQPKSYLTTVGKTAIFGIIATGTNLKYQWQYKAVSSNDWVNCDSAGSTTPELQFPVTSWNKNQTEFRCVVTDGANTVISNSAMLLIVSIIEKYTVTFDSQGGSAVNAITDIAENTKIASLPNPPTRDGYEFIGWYTEPNGQGNVFNENTVVSGNITVYAYWKLQTTATPNGFWVKDISAQRYTGKAIKPFIEVYDGKKLLTEKVDYTLSYKNNIKANDASNAKTAPTVVVKGKGNYSGTEKVTFSILAKSINNEDVMIDDITKAYNNTLQKVVPTVTWNGKKLKNKTDFTVRYPDTDENAYIAEGKYQIEIIGKGNYIGKRVVQLTITNKKLMSKVSVAKVPNQSYTGSAITPELIVKYGKEQLQENVDYSVSYKNNIETGTATVVLTGIGAYCGEKRISFKIAGISINKVIVGNMPQSVMYTGDNITPNPYLVIADDDNEIILKENQDYTVSYQKNKDVGTATVIFKGINNYSGILKKTFKITPYQIGKDIDGKIKVQDNITAVYAVGGSKPKPTVYFGEKLLTEGRDYTLKYINNNVVWRSGQEISSDSLPTVTVCGKGNFTENLSTSFEITPQNIGALKIEISDKVYQNKAGKWKSIPKIKDLNGKTLKAGRDYESEILYTYMRDTTLSDGVIKKAGSLIEPTDILPAGTTVLVSVTGKGNYTGKICEAYRIIQYDISKAKVKIPKQTYTGSEIYPDKDQIEVRIGKTILADADYEIVDYSNNIKKGTATIVIRGTGDYGGIKKATFKITAKGFKWWWR